MSLQRDLPPIGHSSFDLSVRLYKLSGWRGDIEWAEWLPISDQNYPAYTCGYLIRQLAGAVTGFGVTVHIHSPIRYVITYVDVPPPPATQITPYALRPAPFTRRSRANRDPRFLEVWGESVEDALAQFCIVLWRRDKFSA